MLRKTKTTVQVQKQQTKPVAITTKPVKQTKQQPKIAYNKELTPTPVSVEPVEIKTKQPINNEAVEIVKNRQKTKNKLKNLKNSLQQQNLLMPNLAKKFL